MMLLFIKGGHFLGTLNCPSPTPRGPWMKLVPAVFLVWEGQIVCCASLSGNGGVFKPALVGATSAFFFLALFSAFGYHKP